MKILIVQAAPRIGDVSYNFSLIKRYCQLSLDSKVDICLFPELVTTGYSPEDLLLKTSFINDLQLEVTDLLKYAKETALIIPTPIYENEQLYNGAIVLQHGKIIGKTTKKFLPNYGVFDEKRYFTEGNPQTIIINNKKIGIAICEDIWSNEVANYLADNGAEMLLVPNASPYSQGKFDQRIEIVKARFKEINLPIIYCNQIAGQDGIVYDGRSFCYDGEIKSCLKTFTEDSRVVEVIDRKIEDKSEFAANTYSLALEDELYGAMVLSLRHYIINNGFNSIILGLSGGIDSALVAAIAVDSLGSENVCAVIIPSCFNSDESMEDALKIVKMLDIEHKIIPLTDMLNLSSNVIGEMSNLAYQNLQARLRGVILMSIANSSGRLLLSTGNKSENATGYTTIYGDMCGAFNPVKDLYKTQLFKVAAFRNNNIPQSISVQNNKFPVMPTRILTKEPSAELSFGQKDTDALPKYELLDQILYLYIEKNLGYDEIIKNGFEKETVKKIIKLVKNSEFKRRQSAVGTKLSSCDLTKDRRYPITNAYW